MINTMPIKTVIFIDAIYGTNSAMFFAVGYIYGNIRLKEIFQQSQFRIHYVM